MFQINDDLVICRKKIQKTNMLKKVKKRICQKKSKSEYVKKKVKKRICQKTNMQPDSEEESLPPEDSWRVGAGELVGTR